MLPAKILNVTDLNELQSFGSYLDLKNIIENQLGLKLKVKGWDSLFLKVKQLSEAVPKNKNKFFELIESHPFNVAKLEISKLIDLKITAKNKTQLRTQLKNLTECFCNLNFDPSQRFEKTKLMNFQSSSKLEGIDIYIPSNMSSLESIINKYKR